MHSAPGRLIATMLCISVLCQGPTAIASDTKGQAIPTTEASQEPGAGGKPIVSDLAGTPSRDDSDSTPAGDRSQKGLDSTKTFDQTTVAERPEEPWAVSFADDFRTDPRQRYSEVSGSVKWRPGSLTINRAGGIQKRIEAGEIGELTVKLKWPDSDLRQPAKISIMFVVGSDDVVVAELERVLVGGKRSARLRILAIEPPRGWAGLFGGRPKKTLVRSFDGVEDVMHESLTLRYNHQFVQVLIGDRELAAARPEIRGGPISAFFVMSSTDSLQCQGLQFLAIRRSHRTREQQVQLQRTTQLESEMARLYEAGRSREAVPLGKQVLDIRREILGEGSYGYAMALNNMAAHHQSVGDYSQARSLHLQAMRIGKRVLGEEHPDYALILHHLADLHSSTAGYPKTRSRREAPLLH